MIHNDYVLDLYDLWRIQNGFLKMMRMMRGGGQLKIYLLFFSAIVIKIPGRGYLTLWGRVAPRGEPWTFFGLKFNLEFNGLGPKS